MIEGERDDLARLGADIERQAECSHGLVSMSMSGQGRCLECGASVTRDEWEDQ